MNQTVNSFINKQKIDPKILFIVFIKILFLSIFCHSTFAWQKSQSRFIRFVSEEQTDRMQTAVIRYRNNDITIDLVAAVHIADRTYYEKLNKLFKEYDAVLFELVGNKENLIRIKNHTASNQSNISKLQSGMGRILKLKQQIHCIDYSQPNFVHADMDWQTYQFLTRKHKEDIWELMWQESWKQSTKTQGPMNPNYEFGLSDVFAYVFYSDYANRLKSKMAYHFSRNFNNSFLTDRPTVIITERNKKAIHILKKTLSQGRKKIAIFYGAIHMPDFEKRLMQMGYVKKQTHWLTAWHMTNY